jgi:hypothetical protein
MKNGKSPGRDGFTVDFFKLFWKDIGAFVFRSLTYGYESGFKVKELLHVSLREVKTEGTWATGVQSTCLILT